MVLGFMKQFPWGEPTFFREKITLEGIKGFGEVDVPFTFNRKLHTIRAGGRWKPGMKLHMATGVRTKQYNQFNKDIPELQKVKSVQRIDIFLREPDCIAIYIDTELKFTRCRYAYRPGFLKKNYDEDGNGVYTFGESWFQVFLQNDGLTEEQFFSFFKKTLRNSQLIHWTDLKY